jgi:hypothetical protein
VLIRKHGHKDLLKQVFGLLSVGHLTQQIAEQPCFVACVKNWKCVGSPCSNPPHQLLVAVGRVSHLQRTTPHGLPPFKKRDRPDDRASIMQDRSSYGAMVTVDGQPVVCVAAWHDSRRDGYGISGVRIDVQSGALRDSKAVRLRQPLCWPRCQLRLWRRDTDRRRPDARRARGLSNHAELQRLFRALTFDFPLFVCAKFKFRIGYRAMFGAAYHF